VTDIPLAIFVLVGLVSFLLLLIFVYWLVLLIALAYYKFWGKDNNMAESVPKYVPSKLTSWMLQAARESAIQEDKVELPNDTAELEEWRYAVAMRTGSMAKDEKYCRKGEMLDMGGEVPCDIKKEIMAD